MKKIFYLVAIIATVIITIVSFKHETDNYVSLKLDYVPESIENLQDNSELIIIGSFNKVQDVVEDNNVKFYISEVNVDDIIQGELANGTIKLLQTYSQEDPLISQDSQVLLFLERYEGWLSDDNTYVCKGLTYGHYEISNGMVTPSTLSNNLLSRSSLTDTWLESSERKEVSKGNQSVKACVSYLKSRAVQ